MRQRKYNKNRGMDTHTRNADNNKFRSGSYDSLQMISGEISLTQPEPLFRQNMVTVKPSRGGSITSVAYPGAFFDPVSGNLHGAYEGPIPGQQVVVGFENGNQSTPFVVNRYPYQGRGNTLFEEKFTTPLTKNLFHSTDVLMGHFSGSYISLNTGVAPSTKLPGSVTIKSITDLEMESSTRISLKSIAAAEIESTVVKITGTTNIQLNGSTDFAIKYTAMKTAFDTLRTDLNNLVTAYNTHIHITTATVGASAVPGIISPTVSTAIPSIADMTSAQNPTVLF